MLWPNKQQPPTHCALCPLTPLLPSPPLPSSLTSPSVARRRGDIFLIYSSSLDLSLLRLYPNKSTLDFRWFMVRILLLVRISMVAMNKVTAEGINFISRQSICGHYICMGSDAPRHSQQWQLLQVINLVNIVAKRKSRIRGDETTIYVVPNVMQLSIFFHRFRCILDWF